jgi:phosphoribosylaminoimidazole-succinocarboxamide synthase
MLTAEVITRSGKVRDLYAIDRERLVMVASDRISAFDVILPTLIPDKGRVLTGLSRHWFAETAHIVPNHLLETSAAEASSLLAGGAAIDAAALQGRVMVCRAADVLPIEIVVRGYLAGSGWKEYVASGRVCGIGLKPGLRESDRLPEPILTPATKAPEGEHDQNIDYDEMARRLEGVAVRPDEPLGRAGAVALAEQVRGTALALYRFAAVRCERAGVLLADTKFEMGIVDGQLTLVDEALTPDSSRFWDAAAYRPGGPQPSYDKQFVRDWLEGQPWDKTAPGPELPGDVVAGTRARYVEAFERITGASFQRYLDEDVIATAGERREDSR